MKINVIAVEMWAFLACAGWLFGGPHVSLWALTGGLGLSLFFDLFVNSK